MADEDITLDGKPLHSLRVADLKAALEQRNLPKSGQKNTLIKRLKGALMLENLQKSSSSSCGLQPNSQIGEEMCQNSFIKQYLAKQQELLRQRLEREAQQQVEDEESPGGPDEDDDHSEDNDSSSFTPDKHKNLISQRLGGGIGGGDSILAHGLGHAMHHHESPVALGGRMNFQQVHREPQAQSPTRAVASLSVRVLGQSDHQGLPSTVQRAQEKEGASVSEPGSAHSAPQPSQSAKSSSDKLTYEDSDEDDDDDDESDNDEDWGPSPLGAKRGKSGPPPVSQAAPSVPMAAVRSKRKLQPPQHIPPPQVHHSPLQLRHPTPPPSPPPNLFPLPDTPKQSPPDTDQEEAEDPQAAHGKGPSSLPATARQRRDSDSSSRSSSPEPPAKRRPGPLSLLVQKMETEEATSSTEKSEDSARSSVVCPGETSLKKSGARTQESEEKMEEPNRQKEDEAERQHQEPDHKSKKSQDAAKKERDGPLSEEQTRREEKQRKEEQKQEKSEKAKVIVTHTQDSSSSSESESKSDSSSRSSSRSSSSSPSSRGKVKPSSHLKMEDHRDGHGDKTSTLNKEKPWLPKREVTEPTTAAITEVEPDSESSPVHQPVHGVEPEGGESHLEENSTPKAFAARKISLAVTKSSPAATDGGTGDSDSGSAAGRKRRWGSSTAVTAKKPSISITTDSLKSLIPDIKVNQEAVVDLHPDELQMSGDEENADSNRSDPDNGLQIRRTVTQVIPSDRQENGQIKEEEEEIETKEMEKPTRPSREMRKNSVSEEAGETRISVKIDGEAKKVTPSDNLVRRSISQQKSGVSITIDDPVRTARQPSPPRGKVTNIIHVTNLVRPFTLFQLKELLGRTGTLVDDGFWIDKIKSHCYVTYSSTEEAVATREALHGVKWPTSNPKVLRVDFCEQDKLDFHKGVLKPERDEEPVVVQPVAPPKLPPLMPEHNRERERDRDKDRERERERERGVRDLWAERQREMERRERARGEREWDRDKIREFARPGEDGRRSRSRERERRRRERAKSKERKTEKKEKVEEPPAKMLDDLFLKTKSAPCIYWLPLTEEQATQRLLDRSERQKERERRRKELEEEDKKREEEKKERLKSRDKEGGAAAPAGSTTSSSGGTAKRAVDGERVRDREGDKRRESSHRSRRPSAGGGGGGGGVVGGGGGGGGGRRSRSRSNPRDRRR